MHTASLLLERGIRFFVLGSAVVFSHLLLADSYHDPLGAAEVDIAERWASSSVPSQTRAFSRSTETADGSTAQTREATLLIERHPAAKGSAVRRADVYVYNYDRNELTQRVVDLDTQQLVSTTVSQGVQLPLTESEISRAIEVVFADDEELALLKREYERIVGLPLSGIDQLAVKAFSFHADSLPENLNAASRNCGIHRCAQLLLYTHDLIVFEVSPIVDLSEEIVTQNIGF